ncbi:GrpB family protein [Sulfidibacter corallicola]|uniref:GrpB family protein n=1 Tax=Sulfidibacter corallicola TaxID=2818388 RepID=A0A8A4TDT2_SULCO|nr:GrpB family protein [Sulfidibacter corallicola]QTD47720.1 GrpB family protein [Sulfidibacter corallicola]
MPMEVRVVAYDPDWPQMFRNESRQIAAVLGPDLIEIHHIGSTAITGIYAKPIIDMLGEARHLAAVDRHAAEMTDLGYEALGEFGIPGRRYFRKETPEGRRTHHLHVFSAGCDQVRRHLGFRDFMNRHPEWAQRYSALKRKLAAAHPDDIEAYMDGKDPFIGEIDRLVARRQSGD